MQSLQNAHDTLNPTSTSQAQCAPKHPLTSIPSQTSVLYDYLYDDTHADCDSDEPQHLSVPNGQCGPSPLPSATEDADFTAPVIESESKFAKMKKSGCSDDAIRSSCRTFQDFPPQQDFSGYLDIRTRSSKAWKRKYFVVTNNFLLMASTPYSAKLEKVIPLEGSNVSTTTKTGSVSFEILIRKKRNLFRAPNENECIAWTTRIQRASRLRIKDIYHFSALLGSSSSGSTKVLAAKHRVTGEEVAVKVISKKEYNPRMLSNEVLILKRLDHPHVVQLFDIFETKKNVYLVMERCLGGELFEQIANLAAQGGGGFTEKECILVLHQIAKAVQYMHSMGIVHRDLKPENILCVHPNSLTHVKVADFGISKVIFDPEERRARKEQVRKQRRREYDALRGQLANPLQFTGDEVDDEKLEALNSAVSLKKEKGKSRRRDRERRRKIIDPLAKKTKKKSSKRDRSKSKSKRERQERLSGAWKEKESKNLMDTMCGTISYTAPEILRERPYDKRVDYWSLGVLAFMLLCGYPPFWGDTELEVARSILNERVVLDEEDWAHVSEKGKAMVLGLLERNPSKRLGVDDVLKHTWLFAAKQTRSAKARKSFRTTVAKRRIRKMSMGPFEKSSKRMDAIYRHQLKQQRQNHKKELEAQRMAELEAQTKAQLAQLSVAAQGMNSEHAKLQVKLANAQMSANPLSQMGGVGGANAMSRSRSNVSQGSEDSMSAVSPLSMASARSDSLSYSNASAASSMRSAGRESMSFSANDWRRCSRTDDDLFELRLPSNINCTPRGSYADLNPFGDSDGDEDDVGMSGSYSSSSRRRKYSQ